MDSNRRKFMIEMDTSCRPSRLLKKDLDHLQEVATRKRQLMMEMMENRQSPRFFKNPLSYSSDSDSDSEIKIDISEEEEKPSKLQKILWYIGDFFYKDEVEETPPIRNSFTAADVEAWLQRPKPESEFKIRSVRDLIDRWYFKSLANELTKIQPEPLKMETKMNCLNFIRNAQKKNYSNTIYTDTPESHEDETF